MDLLLIITLVTPLATGPVYLTIVISRTEIILCNGIISMKIFNPNVFPIKDSLDLTIANLFCVEIMNKYN